MTLFWILLLWFVVGGLLTTFVQYLLVKYVPRPTNRKTPCIKAGIACSLLRMLLLCWLGTSLVGCPLSDQSFKVLVFADVLATAIQAYYAVRRYGVYARRSGFRTGANIGSLSFGIVFFLVLLW